MKLYTAFDLHSSNSYLAIIDEQGQRVHKKKLTNDPELIIEALKPYKEQVVGVVVESTYNWYWLVDTLMNEGYAVHLAIPNAIQKYSGLKYSDDQHDAFWLAERRRISFLGSFFVFGWPEASGIGYLPGES